MCRRLIFLVSFVFVLGVVLTGAAQADLVAWWKFDEGSGTTAVDSSGNGNDGTLEGGAQWVAGQLEGAIQFNGSNARVVAPHIPLDSQSFTITMWVNPVLYTNQQTVFSQVQTNATNTSMHFRLGGPGGTAPVPGAVRMGFYSNDLDTGGGLVADNNWYHITFWYDFENQNRRIYIDGVREAEAGAAPYLGASGSTIIGAWNTGEWFQGIIDDVQVYDHALTDTEVLAAMRGIEGFPYASRPTPEDGAIYTATWVNCQWSAGDFAVSHDVYFGDNFADVDAGTGGAFRGNLLLGTEYYIAGFAPYAYPDGLIPGTTYYWRIDEVNDLDPNSPWKGKVWSFSIPSNKAHYPVPADDARNVATDVTLSWTPGYSGALHHVFFGDNPDDVAAGTPDTDKQDGPLTTFVPGPLEYEKTYYWRVDEVDQPGNTYTGDVWSFKTLPDIPVTDPDLIGWWTFDEGAGTTALDWSGHGNHGTLRGDPQWVAGYDAGALDFDGSGDFVYTGKSASSLGIEGSKPKTVTAWVYTRAFNNGGIFDLGARSDGQDFCLRTLGGNNNWRTQYWGAFDHDFSHPSLNEWVHFAVVYTGTQSTVYANGVSVSSEARTLDTSTANPFQIACYGWQANFFNGIIDDVRLYNKALTEAEIEVTMRGNPLLAQSPDPADESTPSVKDVLPISWLPGEKASQHDVYFGTEQDAVADADTSTTGIYRGRQSGTSYTPPEAIGWGSGPYYWRIDEYNADGTISKGRIWSFQVADHLIVDNFEDYKGDEVPVTEQIWGQWRDGLGFGAIGAPPYSPGNGTGSEVGDVTTTSYTEETTVHGGDQSMPYWYNNNKPDKFKYSEAKMTLTAPRDWTAEGVKALSLWFRGYPSSTGSFTVAGNTYTMTASGADIWNNGPGEGEYYDEFHFAYKQLTGAGTIIVRVDSVENTNVWAKAGVMIRETLEAGSKHAFVCVTPGSGVSAQGRPEVGAASFSTTQADIAAPHWVKLERSMSGDFTVSHSADGSSWEPVTGATPQNVPMNTNVYIGLALTSHDAALTCEAVFSNVTTTGNVVGQWMHQDIGIISNDAEPMYVAIANSTGQPAVVYHDDPAATQIDIWTEWNIDLKDFKDQGIDLTDVNSIAIGFGDRNNPQAGGWGKMYFDDIALYRPRFIPELVTLSIADLSRNGVVDFDDIGVMAADWLNQGGDGLWYEYCEGSWSVLPNFDLAATAKQGVVNNFDIGVRNQDDNFGFRFSGKIDIAAAGDYTFYTTSDDGSQLFIDGALLVDNDGLHGAVEQSGVVTLTAGLHDIAVTMFELGGGESLDVEYEGPGITRGPIPDDVLSLPAPVSDLNQDGVVDFQDFAILVDEWGQETLWPEW